MAGSAQAASATKMDMARSTVDSMLAFDAKEHPLPYSLVISHLSDGVSPFP